MTELSPAAQAAKDAAFKAYWGWPQHIPNVIAAAVLRAVVDQVIPVTKSPWGSTLVPVLSAEESRKRLLTIANELENS